MKFRISTALLSVTLLSISLGWFIDHRDEEIVGSWHSSDMSVDGYRTTLDIGKDGTFEKVQQYALGNRKVYKGSYSVKGNGTFVFLISETISSSLGEEPISKECNSSFYCRCAIDKSGYLLLYMFMTRFAASNGIEVYARNEARNFRKEEFLQGTGTR